MLSPILAFVSLRCLRALRPFWTTAEFLKFISSAQLSWFSLNTSYDHGCHLANRFRLEPNDYKVLLFVAGLTHYTRFGFALKPTAWSKFLVGGGDENITINHGCGGGNCGGSGNSDGNSDGGGDGGGGDGGDGGIGGGRESDGGVGGGRAMTAMSDDDDDNDDNDGYNDDGRQQWRMLPAPVPIDGAV
jgi:hypothetical protein